MIVDGQPLPKVVFYRKNINFTSLVKIAIIQHCQMLRYVKSVRATDDFLHLHTQQ